MSDQDAPKTKDAHHETTAGGLRERRRDFRRSDIPDTLVSRMFELNEETLQLRKKELLWRNLKFSAIGLFCLGSTAYWMANFHEIQSKLEIVGPYASQVVLSGEIGPGGPLSIDAVEPQITAAFKDEQAKCVVLAINSPGGTPVQAGLIHDRILELKKKHNKKTLVVARDYMASGGYMIGVAGDKLYANGSSIVGSIGVVAASFGFQNVLDKVGVERRVLTAGKSKNGGDPFSPLTPEHAEKMRAILTDMHQQFISKVKAGRGDRLKGDDETIFNADVWTGEKALSLGLIDGLKDVPEVIREECGADQVKDYSKKDFLTSLTQRFGAILNEMKGPTLY